MRGRAVKELGRAGNLRGENVFYEVVEGGTPHGGGVHAERSGVGDLKAYGFQLGFEVGAYSGKGVEVSAGDLDVVEFFAVKGEVGDVRGCGDDVVAEGGGGKRPDAAEYVLVGESGQDSFSSAHGKARYSRMGAVCKGGVGGVDVGHKTACYFYAGKVVGGGQVGRGPGRLAFGCVYQTVHAYDNHFACAVEVVRVCGDYVRVHRYSVYAARP